MTEATPILDQATLEALPEGIREAFDGNKTPKEKSEFMEAKAQFDFLQEIEKFKAGVRKTSKLYSVIKESIFGFMSPDGVLHLQLGLLWPDLLEEQYLDLRRRLEIQLVLLQGMEDGRVMYQLPPDEEGNLPPLAPIVLNMEQIRQQARNDLAEINFFNPANHTHSVIQDFHPTILEKFFGTHQHVLHINSFYNAGMKTSDLKPAFNQAAYGDAIRAYQQSLHRIERRPADPQIFFYARASIKKQEIAQHVEGTFQQMAIDAYLKAQGNK